MEWTIPGTVLSGNRGDVEATILELQGMFRAGGMIRSQVAAVTGVEAHDIQNWVKRGFLPNPVNKRYSCNQFCRIATINMLRSAMPMEKICGLLTYVNGELDDESDDLIDDAVLYFMFLRLAAQARHIGGDRSWDDVIPEILAEYTETKPGARERIDKVLRIMLTAWIGVQTIRQADRMLNELHQG